MTSNLDLIRGRQVVSTLTNKSGGAVIAGDVVIIDTANDESFTTTTTAAYNATQVGIALDSIAANSTGRILLQGYAPLVNVSASATRGYYLTTHTVAKQAASGASFVTGSFGQVLKAGTTPSAYIFPPAIGSSAGITRSGATTDNHLMVWNGSNADSAKDGGAAADSARTILLDSVAGVGGVANFTVSGIPAGFRYIEIFLSGVSAINAATEDILIAFNSDTTNTNYREAYSIGGNNLANGSSDYRSIGTVGGSSVSNVFGTIHATLHDYDGTHFHKMVSAVGFVRSGATEASATNIGVIWENTAAITSIVLTTAGGNNFTQYSRCTVIGWL